MYHKWTDVRGQKTERLRLRGSYRLRPDKIGIVLEGRNRKTLYETSIATVERNTFLTSDF